MQEGCAGPGCRPLNDRLVLIAKILLLCVACALVGAGIIYLIRAVLAPA